jgi:transcriptional regulator with XRE-family HTH domain
MDGDGMRVARQARGETQAQFAKALGRSRITVARWEAGTSAIPPDVAARVKKLHSRAAPPSPLMPKARGKGAGADLLTDKPAPEELVSPELLAAMGRDPPYATTSAEAKAMRQLRAAQLKTGPANIRLLPLRPVWVQVGEGEQARMVNAAIPDPVARPAPEWAGWRGVRTMSGAVYDYETAAPMRGFNDQLGVAPVAAGTW